MNSRRVDISHTLNRVLLLSPVFDFATPIPSPQQCVLCFPHRPGCMISCSHCVTSFFLSLCFNFKFSNFVKRIRTIFPHHCDCMISYSAFITPCFFSKFFKINSSLHLKTANFEMKNLSCVVAFAWYPGSRGTCFSFRVFVWCWKERQPWYSAGRCLFCICSAFLLYVEWISCFLKNLVNDQNIFLVNVDARKSLILLGKLWFLVWSAKRLSLIRETLTHHFTPCESKRWAQTMDWDATSCLHFIAI